MRYAIEFVDNLDPTEPVLYHWSGAETRLGWLVGRSRDGLVVTVRDCETGDDHDLSVVDLEGFGDD